MRQTPRAILEALLKKADQIHELVVVLRSDQGVFVFMNDGLDARDLLVLERALENSVTDAIDELREEGQHI